jgi:hypothetical protein
MRLVNYRDDVVYCVAEELDLDVESIDFTKDRARQITNFANREIRKAWEFYDWPELDVTEERAFATIYADWKTFLRANGSGQPDILFYIPTVSYYRVKAAAPADPPAGTLPTDTDYFEEVTLDDRYIGYDQGCRRAIGKILGVYPSNPRLNGAGRTRIPFRPSEKGIDVQTALNTVFVRFQIRPSKFTSKIYVAGGQYKKGAVVYFDSKQNPDFDGQCYRATADNNNIDPTNTGYWQLVPMPYILTQYVVYRVAARLAPDKDKKQELYALADEALDQEITSLYAQGIRFPRYSLARPGGSAWPFGLSASWYLGCGYVSTSEVTTLTDTCEDSFGEATIVTPKPGDEGGLSAIPIAQDYVDLVFASAKSGPNAWEFTELTVESTEADPNLLEKIFPTTVAQRTAAGCRVWLNAGPTNNKCSLRWRVKAT